MSKSKINKNIKIEGETYIHLLYRRVSWYFIIHFLKDTNITPNQITIFRSILTLISFSLFLQINNIYLYIIGFVIFQFAEILDSTDGDLARYKNLRSKLGIFLETFFDAIITPVWGLIGLIFAYIAYTIDSSYIYFIIWGLIGFSNNIEKSFYINFRGGKNFSHANHSSIYFGFKDKPIREKLRNFIIVSKTWENQWLIFSGLIYVLFKINIFLYIWIWLFLLNQIHWIRLAYEGYHKCLIKKG
jgi:phosphatidylglycerophosphate synthase